jgi:hypothetical protein
MPNTTPIDYRLRDVQRRIRNMLAAYPPSEWDEEESRIVLDALSVIVRGRKSAARVLAEAEQIRSLGPQVIPDDPANPEAAALDLVVRSAEELGDPDDTSGLQEFALLLEVEGAFAGMSWPDAREAAKVIAFDAVLLLGEAVDSTSVDALPTRSLGAMECRGRTATPRRVR